MKLEKYLLQQKNKLNKISQQIIGLEKIQNSLPKTKLNFVRSDIDFSSTEILIPTNRSSKLKQYISCADPKLMNDFHILLYSIFPDKSSSTCIRFRIFPYFEVEKQKIFLNNNFLVYHTGRYTNDFFNPNSGYVRHPAPKSSLENWLRQKYLPSLLQDKIVSFCHSQYGFQNTPLSDFLHS